MRAALFLSGLIVLLVGLLPFLQQLTVLSFLQVIPSTGTTYSLLVTVLGAIILLLGIKR